MHLSTAKQNGSQLILGSLALLRPLRPCLLVARALGVLPLAAAWLRHRCGWLPACLLTALSAANFLLAPGITSPMDAAQPTAASMSGVVLWHAMTLCACALGSRVAGHAWLQEGLVRCDRLVDRASDILLALPPPPPPQPLPRPAVVAWLLVATVSRLPMLSMAWHVSAVVTNLYHVSVAGGSGMWKNHVVFGLPNALDMIAVVASAASAVSEMQRSEEFLRDILILYKDRSVQEEVRLWNSYLKSWRPSFSIYGFFQLEWSLLASATTGAVSYLLLLLQLHGIEKKRQ